MRVNIEFTMTDGGSYHGQATAEERVIIRRADVERVLEHARLHEIPRDYLIVKLPTEIGLRTGEISRLRIEDIHYSEGLLDVLDSKKHRKRPVPLDMTTLQQMEDLADGRNYAYLFRQVASWVKLTDKPLSPQQIWFMTKTIGERAGVKGYSPRIGRAYFALTFYREHPNRLPELSIMMGHKRPEMTMRFYILKFVFIEDIQEAYHEKQVSPFSLQSAPSSIAGHEVCSKCVSLPVCKFAPLPSHATGCRYMKVMEEQKT